MSLPAGRRRMTLVAHDVGGTGGMERVHAELIRRLAAEWDITVVSVTLAEELRHLAAWMRVRVPHRPFPIKFVLFFLIASVRMRRAEPGVVHVCGAIVWPRADVASVHLCHAGVLEATRSLAPRGAPLPRRLNTGLTRLLALGAERWCYRPGRLRVLHAVSRGVAGELARHYPGVEVEVVPNGVDTRRFAPDPHVRGEIRASLDTPEQAMVALFVGGDWDRKRLGLAIEGVARARKGGVDVRLWVVGDGDRGRFERQAQSVGLADTVVFLGRREDVAGFYQAADLLLLPSRYETFSLVAHEAAASGIPVLASPVGGVVDLVGADEAGMLLDDDASTWGHAIAGLARDPARRAALGQEARRRALELDWDRMAERFSALASRLAAEQERISR